MKKSSSDTIDYYDDNKGAFMRNIVIMQEQMYKSIFAMSTKRVKCIRHNGVNICPILDKYAIKDQS